MLQNEISVLKVGLNNSESSFQVPLFNAFVESQDHPDAKHKSLFSVTAASTEDVRGYLGIY